MAEQFEDILLGYNNSLSNFKDDDVYTNEEEGVIIHKITPATAAAVSTRIKPSVLVFQQILPGVDARSVVTGCLAIESTLDPACSNANIGETSTGVARSNPTNDPAKYDMGIAQLKLEYLIGQKPRRNTNGNVLVDNTGKVLYEPLVPGVTDVDSARAFALNLDEAIPYFCSLMSDKLVWAMEVIAKNTSSVPDVRLSNPWLLATGAYNFGETGMLAYYENGTFPSHCQKVIDLEAYFAEKLGVPSIFADLPKAD